MGGGACPRRLRATGVTHRAYLGEFVAIVLMGTFAMTDRIYGEPTKTTRPSNGATGGAGLPSPQREPGKMYRETSKKQ